MASDLDQLIEMGFDQERAQLAVSKAGNRGFSFAQYQIFLY